MVEKRLSARPESLDVAVKAINNIKANAKNNPLFRQLCEANDEEFERFRFYTQVRWLSKAKARHWELQNSAVEFLGGDSYLAKDLIACHQDTSYLADFFEKINTATDKLQGKNVTLVQSKTIICGLINKLEFYQQTLSRRNFYHLAVKNVTDNNLFIYIEHLKGEEEEMNVRFNDLLNLGVFP